MTPAHDPICSVGVPYVLHLGDCLDVMPTLPDGSVDAIIADLPYQTTQNTWDVMIPLDALWREYKRVLKPGGAVVLFGNQPFTSALVMSNLAWFRYLWVWRKSLPTGFLDAWRRPLRTHEDILLFAEGITTYHPQLRHRSTHGGKRKGVPTNNYGSYSATAVRSLPEDKGFPLSVIEFNTAYHDREAGLHPTQKPVALLEYLIRTYTNEGDTVLDNCFGSCSTGVACINTDRRFIGIERDPSYFAIGSDRIERAARAMRQASFLEAI